MKTDEAGRVINKARKIYIKTCPICKEGFEGLAVKIFCSNKCRQKNKYAKKKAAQRGSFYSGIE